MSAGSPKFTISRVAALSLVSLWLAGCTSSNNAPAPVSSVGGSSSSGNTSSGMLITPPPKMGTAAAQQNPPIQPMQPPVTQPTQVQPVEHPVQTQNGRIVYNRKYGNIPKGSYTGGSTYTVKRGDTLWGIAKKFGVTVSAVVNANNIRNPNLIYVGEVFIIPHMTSAESSGYTLYTVRRGDTLWGISRKFGTSINSIVALNGIKNPNLIYAGEVFKIPSARSEQAVIYTVKRGDTLWGISRKFATTVENLVKLNSVKNPNLIYVGEKLIIG